MSLLAEAGCILVGRAGLPDERRRITWLRPQIRILGRDEAPSELMCRSR